MGHELGDLPTAPLSSYDWDTEVLALAIQIAIPPTDWGSRGAISYAREIAEALAYLQVDLTKMRNFNQDFIEARKLSLVRIDSVKSV